MGDFGTFIWGYSGKNVLDVGWNFQHETFIFNRIVAIFPTLIFKLAFQGTSEKVACRCNNYVRQGYPLRYLTAYMQIKQHIHIL